MSASLRTPPVASRVRHGRTNWVEVTRRQKTLGLGGLPAGLTHAQFETIHPFLDGNGRVGRMLIPLLLVAAGAVDRPWLYVRLHFERQCAKYYQLLQRARTHGDWESWLVAIVACDAVDKVRDLLALFDRDRLAVSGSRSGSIYQRVAFHSNLEVYEYLRKKIAIQIPQAAAACRTAKPTVARALEDLERLGIARSATGKPRDRVYVYQTYLDILNRDEGAAPAATGRHTRPISGKRQPQKKP